MACCMTMLYGEKIKVAVLDTLVPLWVVLIFSLSIM